MWPYPRVTQCQKKFVATDTSSDNASEKISKLQNLAHERLTKALLRRPLPPYAFETMACGPYQTHSHSRTGNVDAITELFHCDSLIGFGCFCQDRLGAMDADCNRTDLQLSGPSVHNWGTDPGSTDGDGCPRVCDFGTCIDTLLRRCSSDFSQPTI